MVPVTVIKQLRAYERRKRRESGGILLGYVFEDHDELARIERPTKWDISGFLSFVRSVIPAQRRVNRAWRQSAGHLIYLGEWHTHPGGAPTPSGQDRRMIEDVLVTTEMEIDHVYLVIAGVGDSLWIGRQDQDGLKHLEGED